MATPGLFHPKGGTQLSLAGSGQTTYVANGLAYAAYATPTAMISLSGSATKIVRVHGAVMRISSTAGALYRLYFYKRSAANTDGTFAAQTAKTLDSLSPAQTAVCNLYSAIPSALGAGVILGVTPVVTTVLTAAPASFAMVNFLGAPNLSGIIEPVVLRGTSEYLELNGEGAAIPAGFAAQWELIWTESDY